MAAVVGSERTAMERFGSGGKALLPWTKQMLTVLWEQLRLLVQVIYYTFVSVFQMFRFEVHVRITDETGQHIQHMTTAANPSDSFLFSSLFDGDGGVMVGGANPLSNLGDAFAGKSPAEALLSTLRADDLCCGLVDDFVSGKDDAIFLGHQSGWKMGFPDWNIFLSSSDSSNDGVRKTEDEKSFRWSGEEDQSGVEFDNEESEALWESMSRSSDPYNPFFFSACISTNANTGRSKSDAAESDGDLAAAGKAAEEAAPPPPRGVWAGRSDSESSWSSWAGSEGSGPDEEGERLLEFFSRADDPYNPMCFTARTKPPQAAAAKPRAALPAPAFKLDTEEEEEEKEGSCSPSSEDDEEQLWTSLGQKHDPYHPLNFQACLQSSPTAPPTPPPGGHVQNPPEKCEPEFQKPATAKPSLPDRKSKRHSHPDTTLVPWRRSGGTRRPEEEKKTSGARKQVRFSPVVQVHVMRTWPFARQASRKGLWEEMVRDRDRFRRRVRDAEDAIGRCLAAPHRDRMRAHLDGALK
ncbi:Protein phosphatase 1 regulatory subunit 15B [Liparis tanakae]|uniref:Protein phosphatase 1 regulatory subunit 15B n=1 Tax=Liparis tanakae TaxID=230148 RepID=A0A4Z2G809_9TELE|nr:Protein phosphatase 1 regulatory subunit 15B [Liparis tanakae]